MWKITQESVVIKACILLYMSGCNLRLAHKLPIQYSDSVKTKAAAVTTTTTETMATKITAKHRTSIEARLGKLYNVSCPAYSHTKMTIIKSINSHRNKWQHKTMPTRCLTSMTHLPWTWNSILYLLIKLCCSASDITHDKHTLASEQRWVGLSALHSRLNGWHLVWKISSGHCADTQTDYRITIVSLMIDCLAMQRTHKMRKRCTVWERVDRWRGGWKGWPAERPTIFVIIFFATIP